MQTKSNTLAPTTPAPAVLCGPRALALLQAGYLPDVAPVHVQPETLAIDRRIVRGMKCPGCRHRTLKLKPFAKGISYAALAICGRCGCEEVV